MELWHAFFIAYGFFIGFLSARILYRETGSRSMRNGSLMAPSAVTPSQSA